MKKQLAIKNIIALFLLSVFTLGITPKIALHTLLAHHTDNTTKSNDGKTPQLTKAGFNCRCEDLVAESNFTPVAGITIFNPPVAHPTFTPVYSSYISLPHLLFNLRGPPVSC